MAPTQSNYKLACPLKPVRNHQSCKFPQTILDRNKLEEKSWRDKSLTPAEKNCEFHLSVISPYISQVMSRHRIQLALVAEG